MGNSDDKSYLWVIHPAKERPWVTVTVVLIILFTGFVSTIYMENLFIGILAVFLFVFGLRNFLFPTTYGVNETGVIQKTLGQKWGKPWGYFKRKVKVDNGIFLSPFRKPSRLDNFRGWFLPLKDKEIIEFIERKMEPDNE